MKKILTSNGKPLIQDGKVFLSDASGSGGIIEVEELPTENIQESVIYQVNKISDVDVYSKVAPNASIDNLETSIKLIAGITPDLYYYVVDELPSSPNVSNFETFTPAHIYIYNDIPYAYGDLSLGNMWVELIQLMSALGFDLQNKGYVNNKNEIQDAGVYVTYKLGEQGITSVQKYNLLINNNGSWNSVFKIKTLDFIKNYNLTLEDGSTILTYYHQCSTEEIKDLLYFLQFSYVNEFSAILHSVMNIYGTELNLSASLASNLFFENDENLVSFYVGFNQMLIFKITNDNIIYLKEIRNLNFDILSTGITSNFSSQNKIKENIEFYNSIYISLPYI